MLITSTSRLCFGVCLFVSLSSCMLVLLRVYVHNTLKSNEGILSEFFYVGRPLTKGRSDKILSKIGIIFWMQKKS